MGHAAANLSPESSCGRRLGGEVAKNRLGQLPSLLRRKERDKGSHLLEGCSIVHRQLTPYKGRNMLNSATALKPRRNNYCASQLPTRTHSHFNSATGLPMEIKFYLTLPSKTHTQFFKIHLGRGRIINTSPSFSLTLHELSVLDQPPRYRLALVRGHDVSLSDWCSGGRISDHLPYPALRTPLPRPRRRPNRMTSHLERSFCNALNKQGASRTLTLAREPQGSLFVRAASQTPLTSAGETRQRLAGSFLFDQNLIDKPKIRSLMGECLKDQKTLSLERVF